MATEIVNKFPLDFDQQTLNAKLIENAINSESISKARKYIIEQSNMFIKKHEEFFILNLTEYNPVIRKIVLDELSNRFNHIGSIQFDYVFGKSISVISKFKKDNINPYYEIYIIAISETFGNRMDGRKINLTSK